MSQAVTGPNDIQRDNHVTMYGLPVSSHCFCFYNVFLKPVWCPVTIYNWGKELENVKEVND